MDATIAFTILLLGLFSILELIKANQKFSFLKYFMLVLLFWITMSSFLDYLYLTGYAIPYYYYEISKFFGTGLFINLFYLLVFNKIPRIVIIIDVIFVIFFGLLFINGNLFPSILNKQVQGPQNIYHKVFYVFYFSFIICSVIFVYIKLHIKKERKNLYEIKINQWVNKLFIVIFILILLHVLFFVLFLNGFISFYAPTNYNTAIVRFCLIFFILFRPKFLDDDAYSKSFDQILDQNNGVDIKDFEFLFYTNRYYLQQKVNMEDFALKLNVTKNELAIFLKEEIREDFNELLNKHRVEYLKELLKSKKYESFTIEALSEMSGFNNRRTMYYAFNKYTGMTPTEFIHKLN
jgi:AraC-like DNA-binding protein